FLNNLYRIIGATTIDHQVLKIRIALEKNGTDSFLEKHALIQRRSDDANPGPRKTLCSLVWQSSAFFRPRPAGFSGWRRRKLTQFRTLHGAIQSSRKQSCS